MDESGLEQMKKLTMFTTGFGLDHRVKKSKRGACKHEAATVRRTTT